MHTWWLNSHDLIAFKHSCLTVYKTYYTCIGLPYLAMMVSSGRSKTECIKILYFVIKVIIQVKILSLYY